MGPVYRAHDPQTDRLVAIKLFRLDLPPERVHQLVAEFDRVINAQLTHPAIAAPLATGIVGNHAYLAAEFVPAESLDIIVRDHGPAPLSHAIGLAAQLAGAIDFAAVVHISHGVLHPRDVLVSQEETRITGFGIAQALDKVGVSVPVRRPYTAPERLEGRAWGREADIFSVAAICYELLMGRRIAGAGGEAAAGLSGIAGLDVELARAVFARALAIDPALRYPSALEFVDALRQCIVENAAAVAEPQVERPGEDARELRRPRKRVEPDPRRVEDDGRLPLETAAASAPASPVKPPEPTIVDPEIHRAGPVPDLPVTPADFRPSDLELRAAEADRYTDVETSPAVIPVPEPREEPFRADSIAIEPPPVAPPIDELKPSPATAHERASDIRIARATALAPGSTDRRGFGVWPLAAALLFGIVIGFAIGYGVGSRGTPGQSAANAAAGREFTETAVPPPADTEKTAPPGNAQAPPSQSTTATTASPSGAPGQAGAASPSRAEPSTTGTPGPAAVAAAPATGQSTPPAAANERTARPATPPPAAEPSRAATESPASGRILVRSTPSDALVYVDGRERGRTPVAVRDLARGTHSIRVVRDGYATEERRVVLTARRPSQSLQVSLPRAGERDAVPASGGETFVGALTVESRPSGASVYVDGRLVGTTPLSVPSLSAGSHAVRLEHDGYRRWSSSVRVVAGERNRVTASLEK